MSQPACSTATERREVAHSVQKIRLNMSEPRVVFFLNLQNSLTKCRRATKMQAVALTHGRNYAAPLCKKYKQASFFS